MKLSVLCVVLIKYFHIYNVQSANLPGPLVYVVTPSSKPPQVDMGRAAPFYYSNWMKRMDTASTTTTQNPKTPDLIFAEFESDNSNMKSIRKLLEKEKIEHKVITTTSQPIYVPDEDTNGSESDKDLPQSSTEKPKKVDMTDYFALYNNLYNTGPVYVPSPPSLDISSTSTSTPSTTTTPTTQIPINNVENIWHIIDNEKHDQYSGKWEQVHDNSEQTKNDAVIDNKQQNDDDESKEPQTIDEGGIDDNFALPGFGTNPGNGGENESRAIRTESNIRFPYVNLKPFMIKNLNTKKSNNMFSLDNFSELKNPVRGEVQDNIAVPNRQPIDRYNPAQPYLPDYGPKTKPQSTAPSIPVAPAPPRRPPPVRTVANLVPPPPPQPPKLTADGFPTPSTYESFPPYAPGASESGPSFSLPSSDTGTDSSDNDGDSPPPGLSTDLGYRYKPQNPPAVAAPPSFVPTLPPMSKPFPGYSYNKPPMMEEDSPPDTELGDKPDFQGYHYSKPVSGYSYNKPTMTHDTPPTMNAKDKPDFEGYHYKKPSPPEDHPTLTYGHHEEPPPSYHPETDYPDLIFDKPHGGMGDMKGGDDMKSNDAGMMPPPPPPADNKPDSYGVPMDDHGFPHDFPGDFKYAHDFDEHDYHQHHHHHTTTTTTTEMPRVNRYSYYYLGKKLYYLPLYFSVYFVVYVGALIIKAVLRHKITYPNSYRPNDQTASFFSKRSIESHLSNENLHEITGRVTKAIATAAEKYASDKNKDK